MPCLLIYVQSKLLAMECLLVIVSLKEIKCTSARLRAGAQDGAALLQTPEQYESSTNCKCRTSFTRQSAMGCALAFIKPSTCRTECTGVGHATLVLGTWAHLQLQGSVTSLRG